MGLVNLGVVKVGVGVVSSVEALVGHHGRCGRRVDQLRRRESLVVFVVVKVKGRLSQRLVSSKHSSTTAVHPHVAI